MLCTKAAFLRIYMYFKIESLHCRSNFVGAVVWQYTSCYMLFKCDVPQHVLRFRIDETSMQHKPSLVKCLVSLPLQYKMCHSNTSAFLNLGHAIGQTLQETVSCLSFALNYIEIDLTIFSIVWQ